MDGENDLANCLIAWLACVLVEDSCISDSHQQIEATILCMEEASYSEEGKCQSISSALFLSVSEFTRF
jgi:hypothetical protein